MWMGNPWVVTVVTVYDMGTDPWCIFERKDGVQEGRRERGREEGEIGGPNGTFGYDRNQRNKRNRCDSAKTCH